MIRAVMIFFILLVVTSCAPKHKEISPDLQERVKQDIVAGNFPATCGYECFWSYMEYNRAMQSLYIAERWKDLSELVAMVGYENDAAYYYIGRSAEELGYPQSAMTYYEHSIELSGKKSTRCNDPSYCHFNAAEASRGRLKYLKSLENVVNLMAPKDGNSSYGGAAREAGKTRKPGRAITKQTILNLTYADESSGARRTLKNGKWTSGNFPYHPDGCETPGCSEVAVDNMAFGDLNTDGSKDGAFILYSSGNGPGHEYILRAVYYDGEKLMVTPFVYIGNRIHFSSITIRGGKVICIYYDRKPMQAMADKPTVRVLRTFVLKSGVLTEELARR